jgi:nucleoside-diphosphate-sugar epimerase
MNDRDLIAKTVRTCDAAVHAAVEYSAEVQRLDRSVVEAVGEGFSGSGKAFLYTSGIWVMGDTGGRIVDETSPVHPTPLVAWRPEHEQLVLKASGFRGIVIRPAVVYGRGGGLVGGFARAGAATGVVQIVGTGENRWPLVDVEDLADLYVLALNAEAGSVYFAAAGPSIPVRSLAAHAAPGAQVQAVPVEEARKTMGPLADALVLDQQVTAKKAVEELRWNPSRPGVLQ